MAFDLSKIGVKKNIPKVNFTDYTGIFICPPKWGKTTIASMYPKAIILPFEKGFNAQVVNYVEGMDTWEDFIDFVDKLENNRDEIGDEIQTLVFDTVNEAYEKCLPYMLKTESRKQGQKFTAIGDLPYGQGYTKLDSYFKEQIDRILNLGFSILFISHSKIKTIKPKNGEPYDTYSSTMPDRLEKIVYPLVDYIIFGEKEKITDNVTGKTTIKRKMVVGSNVENESGSRVALNTDIIFDTEEEAVEKFQEHFKNVIEEKLRKNGITKNIDSIAKEQREEKKKQVKEFIEKNKELEKRSNNPDLVAIIQDKYPKATEEIKENVKAIMKKYNIPNFKNPDELSNEGLQKIVEILS